MARRVVVTGLGVISCIGNDVNTFWNSLKNGVCGLDYIAQFEEAGLPVKIAGKIKDFNPEEYGMDKPFIRKQDPFTVFAMASAFQAMNDSGLVVGENIDAARLSTYVSSGIGGFATIQREIEKMVEDPSGQWISPLFVPTMISDMAAGQIAIKYGAQGSCLDIVTACATATHSIGEAYRAILHGYTDAVITGGTDHCAIPIGAAAFGNARTLSRAEDPNYASLPFNANRSGFVMADGSAVLVLEEMEHAIARGAHIYAEMVGYGSTCDAYHATAPRPDGSTQGRCIREALDQAGFDETKDTVYINAHGTGTQLNDVAETAAYKLAFGDAAYKIHISSTKSMHGHMFGATGAAEAIAAILALGEGIVPPTINLDTPDPACDLDYTPNKAVKAPLTLSLSDSFGFGGHNACIAFRKI
ncbi:MAG: beta-ketoacyl-ACP synthase II [Bacteroidales bacterium]|nr:beta-ketoacyl-ACP synthase II [Bacteroidales bacterium]